MLLRKREVIERLRIHENTLYKMIRVGDLPATKVGRTWRVDERDVDAYLARNRKVY